MILGWSNPGSAMIFPLKMLSTDYMKRLNDQDFPSMDFFSSLKAREYFKMTMPAFIFQIGKWPAFV